ncbi:PQQ-binding-like beta-propeller repeat protein [Candidatus Poribacteria bacterium]|nr:PQQ-binding-like beta-propeller repeat protein [Candidatus Poribacteria bacterium]
MSHAIDLETGKLKWKYQASDEIKSSPSVLKNVVYFGDEKGVFHAVDARTGQQKWMFRADAGIISSANFAGDRVLFGSYDQYLYCLSVTDGSLIWKLETEGYIHGTPAIADGTAVITGCDGYLRVVSVRNGTETGQIALGDYVGASPALLKVETPPQGRDASRVYVYVGTFGNQVLCIDLKNAKILWRYEHPKWRFPFYASAAVTPPLVRGKGGVVVVGGRDKIVHALNSDTGEARWTFAARSRVDSSPVIVRERVFFGTTGGEIYALNINSGEQVWQFVTGSSIVASPGVAAGKLVIGSADGVLYCFGER